LKKCCNSLISVSGTSISLLSLIASIISCNLAFTCCGLKQSGSGSIQYPTLLTFVNWIVIRRWRCPVKLAGRVFFAHRAFIADRLIKSVHFLLLHFKSLPSLKLAECLPLWSFGLVHVHLTISLKINGAPQGI
jgi:hypothetical protein